MSLIDIHKDIIVCDMSQEVLDTAWEQADDYKIPRKF